MLEIIRVSSLVNLIIVVDFNFLHVIYNIICRFW